MVDQSMRGLIKVLENNRELKRIEREVDPNFEIASVLALRERGHAQFFAHVKRGTMPVVGNIFNDRARFAQALGIRVDELDARCIHAIGSPIPPTIVTDAPVQSVVHAGPCDVGALLPVPHWFEKEKAPYITAGVIVAKDPETRRRNVSIARLRLQGGNRLLAGIAKNHHLSILAEKARSRKQPLEIAVAIGNHAAILLGSQMYVGLGDDEFEIAGGLLGEPVELIKCKSVDLEVPAHAEIVIEGEIKPEDLVDEGAVSEFPGFYVYYGPAIGVEVKCITQRRDAIYQAILPGFAAEHCLLGAVAIGATLTRDLQRSIPAVRRVFITEGGMGRLHAIITMHRPRLGEGKRAALLAMSLVNLLKYIVVVDDDINPEDSRQVEWSLAARFRGHEDLIVLPGVKADRCDPLHENLVVTKIAMVATTRPGDGTPGGRSEFAAPPAAIYDRVRSELDAY